MFKNAFDNPGPVHDVHPGPVPRGKLVFERCPLFVFHELIGKKANVSVAPLRFGYAVSVGVQLWPPLLLGTERERPSLLRSCRRIYRLVPSNCYRFCNRVVFGICLAVSATSW